MWILVRQSDNQTTHILSKLSEAVRSISFWNGRLPDPIPYLEGRGDLVSRLISPIRPDNDPSYPGS